MDRKYADIHLPYVFLGLTLVFLLVTGLTALLGDKAAVQLALNAYHRPWLDVFMRYYTQMGEWVPYVVVVGLLFYKAGWSLFLLTNLALSGLIAQQLKYVFSTLRPIRYFHDFYPDVTLPLVEGQHMSEFYSMPSGHTVSLFVLFLTLSIIVCENNSSEHDSDKTLEHYNNKTLKHYSDTAFLQCLFFLLAVLGAYSRIYLNMHFVEDLFGGAMLATIFTLFLLIFVPKLQKKPFFGWKIKKMRVK